MGIYWSKKCQQLFYHTKLRWQYSKSSILQTYSEIIAENIENLPNPSSYTIVYKIVRNSHLLSHKIGIFSSATAIVLQTSINCSHTKSSKQQLTAHMSIVKGNMAKCYKHAPFSSNALLCSLVLKSKPTFTRRKIQNK